MWAPQTPLGSAFARTVGKPNGGKPLESPPRKPRLLRRRGAGAVMAAGAAAAALSSLSLSSPTGLEALSTMVSCGLEEILIRDEQQRCLNISRLYLSVFCCLLQSSAKSQL